jgi:hypothetical protein
MPIDPDYPNGRLAQIAGGCARGWSSRIAIWSPA